MDANAKKQGLTIALVGIGVSFIAPLTGGLVESASVRQMGSYAAPLGILLCIYGCIQIAKAKGHPWFYGLLGAFSCLGLGVLWFAVSDKNAPPK